MPWKELARLSDSENGQINYHFQHHEFARYSNYRRGGVEENGFLNQHVIRESRYALQPLSKADWNIYIIIIIILCAFNKRSIGGVEEKNLRTGVEKRGMEFLGGMRMKSLRTSRGTISKRLMKATEPRDSL